VAPPGYLGTPIFNPSAEQAAAGASWRSAEPAAPPHPERRDGDRVPGRTSARGDVLTATSHVASYEETKGSLGEMLITTNKTVYKNQDGKVVAISTGTGIRY